jgi:hypothetical protein
MLAALLLAGAELRPDERALHKPLSPGLGPSAEAMSSEAAAKPAAPMMTEFIVRELRQRGAPTTTLWWVPSRRTPRRLPYDRQPLPGFAADLVADQELRS